MDVSLTPELQELVKKKVESGLYHTAGEVIGEGVRLLDERDRLYEVRLETLRAEIKKGLDSGRSVAGEQVFRELRIKAQPRTRRNDRT